MKEEYGDSQARIRKKMLMGVDIDDFLIGFYLSCWERLWIQMYDWGGFGPDRRGRVIFSVIKRGFLPFVLWF